MKLNDRIHISTFTPNYQLVLSIFSKKKRVLSIATDNVITFPHGHVEYPHTFSRYRQLKGSGEKKMNSPFKKAVGPFFVSHVHTSDHFLFPRAMSQSGSHLFFLLFLPASSLSIDGSRDHL